MKNPAFYICENKEPDQLHSNCAANQRLCFLYYVQFLDFLNPHFQAFSHQPTLCQIGSETLQIDFEERWLN